ncbi:MAG: S-methyl-5'-thioadenosine phosphorylase [Methanobrevibacter sp.]|jgi:5'-methylthioadenosine phosphorylase|nr:S-methyl-5'-thioadenosine phosphorylase [Candidatus Methanoflexus mossambicus]
MIGIIGGSGVYEIANRAEIIETKEIKTPFGYSSEITILSIGNKNVVFLPRHTGSHSIPPHKINYAANIWALKELSVNQIIATNAVGSLDLNIPPGSFVAVDDFIDFTTNRKKTFYDDKVVHVDVSEPYCNRLREALVSNGNVIDGGVYLCVDGPRFETPAEIKMFKDIGGDLVGMTGLPEVVLARELEMCYSSICTVSNFGASISPNKITMDEVFEIMEVKNNELVDLIFKTISKLPENFDCSCLHSLDGSGN